MPSLPIDTLHDLARETRARMTFLCSVAPMLDEQTRARCKAEMLDLFGLLRAIDKARVGRYA